METAKDADKLDQDSFRGASQDEAELETKMVPLHLQVDDVQSKEGPSGANNDVSFAATCPICYEEFEDNSIYETEGEEEEVRELENTTIHLKEENNDRKDTAAAAAAATKSQTHNENPENISRKKTSRKRQRIRIEGCNHEFCRPCLAKLCKISISSKNIPIPCPKEAEHIVSSSSCHDQHDCNSQTGGHHLSSDLVKSILTGFCSVIPNWECDDDAVTTLGKEDNMDAKIPSDIVNRTFSTESLSDSDESVSTASSVSSSTEYWNQYLRLERLREHPTLLSCTKCNELIPPPVIKPDEDQQLRALQNTENEISPPQDEERQDLPYPQVRCSHCDHQFCAEHGDIHSGLTCAEFAESKQAKMIQQSEKTIAEMTKPCSHLCGARIALVSGCDHVICTNCNQDMCYRCGTHEYLTGKVIRSCSECRQGFVDHRHYCEYRFHLLLLLPFYLLGTAIYFAFACIAFVLSCGFCCCFGLGTCQPQRPEQTRRYGHLQPSSSSEGPRDEEHALQNKRPLAPGKGLWMVCKLLCYPMFDLVRDCACLPEHEDEGDVEDPPAFLSQKQQRDLLKNR